MGLAKFNAVTSGLAFGSGNSGRQQALNNEGRLWFLVRFPKFKKGGYSVHKEVTDPTYGEVTVCILTLSK